MPVTVLVDSNVYNTSQAKGVDPTNAVSVELKLPPQQYEQLTMVAQAAVTEGLEHQAQLERARALMRGLGRELGQGRPMHDAARHHDDYLYAPEHA